MGETNVGGGLKAEMAIPTCVGTATSCENS